MVRPLYPWISSYKEAALFRVARSIIWLMLTRKNGDKEQRQLERAMAVEKLLAEGEPLGFPTPVGSVADRTTRTLDKARREKS
jgi:hypothetical protein